MSNHIHILAQSIQGDLSGFIRDFKSFTCKQFMSEIKKSTESRKDWMKMVFEYHGKYKAKQQYQFWTTSNHAELIYSQKFIEQKVNYIHNNPVKNGLVEKPEDYLYSSARNYADREALLDVILLDLGVNKKNSNY